MVIAVYKFKAVALRFVCLHVGHAVEFKGTKDPKKRKKGPQPKDATIGVDAMVDLREKHRIFLYDHL